MNRRNTVLASLALGGLPFSAWTQQLGKVWRIGSVSFGSEATFKPIESMYRARLGEFGYVEGRNLILNVRYADGDPSRFPVLLDEILALKPDVIVGGDFIARMLNSKGSQVPVLLMVGSDPVGAGLARTLAQPGGNVTGYVLLQEELIRKHAEIAKEMLPGIKRIGQILDQNLPAAKMAEASMRSAAKRLGLDLTIYPVANPADIDEAMTRMAGDKIEFLFPGATSGLIYNSSRKIVRDTMRMRIPYSTFIADTLVAGALFLYGPSLSESVQVVSTLADKIFRGAKPGNLPIEQATRFELVLNLKTAKALGMTIPQPLLLRADEVIQ